MLQDTRTLAAASALAALLALSCGEEGNPAATGTPAPQAVAAQAVNSACRLGLGDPNATCGQGGPPTLLPQVEAAIDLLVQQKPLLFDFTDVSAPDTTLYKVLDAEGYLDGIVANLVRQGACAQRDPDDVYYEKILVKVSRDYSETYDVLTSDGYIRRGNGSHVDSSRGVVACLVSPPSSSRWPAALRRPA